ncbi:hypothetical protein CN918_26600 [Priestia megaterium]|nr:hypothetical protein CN918_26600 [Priestia megaterium]
MKIANKLKSWIKKETHKYGFAEGDGKELEVILGIQMAIEQFVEKRNLKPDLQDGSNNYSGRWENIYNHLYRLVSDEDRKILSRIKDDLILLGRYELLWTEFTHREEGRKKREKEQQLDMQIEIAYPLFANFWYNVEEMGIKESEIQTCLNNIREKHKEEIPDITEEMFVRCAYGYHYYTKDKLTDSPFSEAVITVNLLEKAYVEYEENEKEKETPDTETELLTGTIVFEEEETKKEEKQPVKPIIIQHESQATEVDSEDDFFAEAEKEVNQNSDEQTEQTNNKTMVAEQTTDNNDDNSNESEKKEDINSAESSESQNDQTDEQNETQQEMEKNKEVLQEKPKKQVVRQEEQAEVSKNNQNNQEEIEELQEPVTKKNDTDAYLSPEELSLAANEPLNHDAGGGMSKRDEEEINELEALAAMNPNRQREELLNA